MQGLQEKIAEFFFKAQFGTHHGFFRQNLKFFSNHFSTPCQFFNNLHFCSISGYTPTAELSVGGVVGWGGGERYEWKSLRGGDFYSSWGQNPSPNPYVFFFSFFI